MLSSSLIGGSQQSLPSMDITASLSTIYDCDNEPGVFQKVFDKIMLAKDYSAKLKKKFGKQNGKGSEMALLLIKSEKTHRKLQMCGTKKHVQSNAPERNLLAELFEVESGIEKVQKQLQNPEAFPTIEARLFGEKLLLISTLKKTLLDEALSNPGEYLVGANCKKIDILFGNVQFFDAKLASRDNYYLCLFITDHRIYSTEIIKPDQNGVVKFTKDIIIKDLRSNYIIEVLMFKTKIPQQSSSLFRDIFGFLAVPRRSRSAPKLGTCFKQVGVQYISPNYVHWCPSKRQRIQQKYLQIEQWCENSETST